MTTIKFSAWYTYEDMGYTKNTITGVSWTSGFRVVTRGFSFLKIIILARLLGPSLLGVFGIATLVLSFLEILTETGINVILIQSKKEIKEIIDSAWVVSILRGVIIALLILTSSPLIIRFFNTPEALGVVCCISLVPLIKGFINPAEVEFQRNLSFQKEFWFRTSIFVFDAIATIMIALLTRSVYSLVGGLIAGAILEVVLSFVFIKPTPRFRLHKGYFSELFHQGKWVTGYSILNYFAQQGDNITVGRVMGSGPLGIYQLTYNLAILPISEVSDVVSKVVFPVFTKISDEKKRLQAAFIKTELVVLSLSLLIGMVLFFFAQQIMMLLGKQWLPAVPVLKLLAFYGIFRTIAGPASALFLSLGKQVYVTNMTFLRFLGLIVTIYPFVLWFGLIGAGYSALFSVLLETPVIIYYVIRIFSKEKYL